MTRTGIAAVLFALVCCLLVGPAPARRPVELPPQAVLDAVGHKASAEPLLTKPLAMVEAADPSTILSLQPQEVDPARQAPQVFRCGGEDMAVSEEPLSHSHDTRAQPAGKGEVEEDVQEQERRDDDSDSDTDGDSDSDDEDNEGGILGWFWRLARRF